MFIKIDDISTLIPSINFATRAVAHILETKSDLLPEKRIVRWRHMEKVTQVSTSDGYIETTIDFRGWGMRVKVVVEEEGSHISIRHYIRSISVTSINWICTRNWGWYTFTAEEVGQMKIVAIQS